LSAWRAQPSQSKGLLCGNGMTSPGPPLSGSPNGPGGISILSMGSRNVVQSIAAERQERIQGIEDIWEELDKFKLEMAAMAQAIVKVSASAAENTEGLPTEASSKELRDLHAQVAGLRHGMDRQQQELATLRRQPPSTAVAEPTSGEGAADASGSKLPSVIANFFSSSDLEPPIVRESTDEASSRALMGLRVRLEALEYHCRQEAYMPQGPKRVVPLGEDPQRQESNEVKDSGAAQHDIRITSLERKVKDHSQSLATLHEGISEVHATMSMHALWASRIAINVVEMTPEQRHSLNNEIGHKVGQLNLEYGAINLGSSE